MTTKVFVSLEEYRDATGKKDFDSSKPADVAKEKKETEVIQPIVAAANKVIMQYLDLRASVFMKTDPVQVFFFNNIDTPAKDIVVNDEDGNVLTGLTGANGIFTLNNEYIGAVTFTNPDSADFWDYPELKMAVIQLARHYENREFVASASSGGQSVSFVPTNMVGIPKHILSFIHDYRM